jgi:hypothetical protein
MAKKKLKARGNFRKVTPAVAEKYVNFWKKRGVTTAGEIPDGKNATVQRIRLKEALDVHRKYLNKLVGYEGEKAAYEAKLAEFKSLENKKVFEHAGLPAKYVRPKAPVKPAKTGPRSVRGGNFKRVSKKQASTYMRSLFTRAAKNAVAAVEKTKTGKPAKRVTLESLSEIKGGRSKRAQASRSTFSPRLQEAVLLLGPEKSAQMWVNAQTVQTKLAEKKAKNAVIAEKRKKTADAAKLAKCQKQVERAQKRLGQLQAACAGITAARRARRSRRSSRRLRRRARR